MHIPHPKPTLLHTNRYVSLVPVVKITNLCRHNFSMLHVLRRRIAFCRANISTRGRELPQHRQPGSCSRCKITYSPTGSAYFCCLYSESPLCSSVPLGTQQQYVAPSRYSVQSWLKVTCENLTSYRNEKDRFYRRKCSLSWRMNALLQIQVKIHYHIHMSQPLVSILSETNSVQNLAFKVF